VELFANEYVNGCYWAIAEMLDLQYFYDIGQPTLPESYPARPILDPQRTAAPLSFSDPEALAERILSAIA
jgi:hypothetical protein